MQKKTIQRLSSQALNKCKKDLEKDLDEVKARMEKSKKTISKREKDFMPEQGYLEEALFDLDKGNSLDMGNKRMIELALEKIKKGTYETCSKCKKQIPHERLIRYPRSTICVPCGEKT